MFLKAVRAGDGEVIAEKVDIADSFLKRFQGLMFRADLPEKEGLLLVPCNQIHMMFMRFPIDAVFLDTSNQVVNLYHDLSPWWGLSGWHRQAEKVLELRSGTLVKKNVKTGDRLNFDPLTI